MAPERLATEDSLRYQYTRRGTSQHFLFGDFPYRGTRLTIRVSMRNLPREIRSKAIEIANALLREGYDEGKAIRIAIAKAKEWAKRGRSPYWR